eukprot:12650248-Prorocentrum_lima.AAC.1
MQSHCARPLLPADTRGGGLRECRRLALGRRRCCLAWGSPRKQRCRLGQSCCSEQPSPHKVLAPPKQ